MGNLKKLPYTQNTEDTLLHFDGLLSIRQYKFRVPDKYKPGMYYQAFAYYKECFLVTTDMDCFNIPVELFYEQFNRLNHKFLRNIEIKSFEILWKYLSKKQKELYFLDSNLREGRRVYMNTLKVFYQTRRKNHHGR